MSDNGQKASFEKHGAPTEKWLKKEVEAIMKKGELSAELDWKSIQFKPENKKGKQKEKVVRHILEKFNLRFLYS